jgi:hypothetical protein
MKFCDVFQDGNLSVPAGGQIDVLFNSEREDASGMHASNAVTIKGDVGIALATAQVDVSHPEMTVEILPRAAFQLKVD